MTPDAIAAVEASLVSTRFLGCSTRVAPSLAATLARVEAGELSVEAGAHALAAHDQEPAPESSQQTTVGKQNEPVT